MLPEDAALAKTKRLSAEEVEAEFGALFRTAGGNPIPEADLTPRFEDFGLGTWAMLAVDAIRSWWRTPGLRLPGPVCRLRRAAGGAAASGALSALTGQADSATLRRPLENVQMSKVSQAGVFDWKPIYAELATALLRFESDRPALVRLLSKLADDVDAFRLLGGDRLVDGTTGFVRDICPFTVFGTFNRGVRDETRLAAVRAMAAALHLSTRLPSGLSGIPLLNNQQSWLFPYEQKRASDHIDALWALWVAALRLADDDVPAHRAAFVGAFDRVQTRPYCAWNVTFGLFCARPDFFVPLDVRSRRLLTEAGFRLGTDGPGGRVSGANYLDLIDAVKAALGSARLPFASIAEMSHGAFMRAATGGDSPDADETADDIGGDSGGHRVWLVAAGEGGRSWAEWRQRGVVSIGIADVALTSFGSQAEIFEYLTDERGGVSRPIHDAAACWAFVQVMAPGDEVFVKRGRSTLLGVGHVTGEYTFVSRGAASHERTVLWERVVEAALPDEAAPLVTKTLTDITRDAPLLARLRGLAGVSDATRPEAASAVPRTLLFTWNPERWRWPEMEAEAARLAATKIPYDSTWSTGTRRDVQPGDRFFLLRQGPAPRGIVGAGVVRSAPVEVPHWDSLRREAGDTSLSCEVRFDALAPRDIPLTIEALENAGLGGMNWHPQVGGTQVPEALVERIEEAWRNHLRRMKFDAPAGRPYTVDTLIEEGCFVSRARLTLILERLRSKKNLILQGAPGTGKTWLARRLGQILVGGRDPERVRVVQFHPNVSYEDFVRGYRPTSDGRLRVANGVFLEAVAAALGRPDVALVVVIEEINRGQPAQVFGELLTLLEASKRSRENAVELIYPDPAEGARRRPVHLPENLYLIGTMNTADRSIAMVDLAFRRRFVFETLTPAFGEQWMAWLRGQGVPARRAEQIGNAIRALNETIEVYRTLGRDFCVGHSFFTPTERFDGDEDAVRRWVAGVVDGEIAPLLEEYWFDDRPAAEAALRSLRGALEV